MKIPQYIVLLLACAGCLTLAQAKEYDLAALESLAIGESQVLLGAREQLNAAQAAVQTASAYPNPELEYLRGDSKARVGSANTGTVQSLALTQPLDLPWRRSARIAAAEAGLEASSANFLAQQAAHLARLRVAFYEVLRREAEQRFAREDMALVEGMRSRIALRVETGEAPRFELIKAEAEALNAQKVAQAAGFRVEQARSLLRQSVGHALPREFSLRGQLRDVPALPQLSALREALVRGNPELARARAELSQAERQLELERAQRWPNVALKATVDEDPELRASKFGVVLAVPLWDRRSGPVAEAAAAKERYRYQLSAQEFSMAQAIEVAFQQYEIASTQVLALESGIVKSAETALKVAEAAYRFGERGFLEVIDAQRVYRAARSELIAARFELASAWVEIERLRAMPGGKRDE